MAFGFRKKARNRKFCCAQFRAFSSLWMKKIAFGTKMSDFLLLWTKQTTMAGQDCIDLSVLGSYLFGQTSADICVREIPLHSELTAR